MEILAPCEIVMDSFLHNEILKNKTKKKTYNNWKMLININLYYRKNIHIISQLIFLQIMIGQHALKAKVVVFEKKKHVATGQASYKTCWCPFHRPITL